MKIIVFSDSHRELDGMRQVIRREKPDYVFHLGDHDSDAEQISKEFQTLPVAMVRGNCDGWYSDAPEFLRFSADGVGIYMTHGHRQNVKMTLEPLANTVHFSGAQLGLFGHTHCSEYKKMGDVTLFNPGSAGRGRRSWGLITVKGTEFTCTLMDM